MPLCISVDKKHNIFQAESNALRWRRERGKERGKKIIKM